MPLRVALFALVWSFLAPDLAAQATRFGVTAGLHVANVGGFAADDLAAAETSPRLGVAAGAFAEFPISARFGFRPEAFYSQKGFSFVLMEEGEGSITETNTDLFVDYLDVSVLGNVRARLTRGLHVGVLAGPVVSFKLNESRTTVIRTDGEVTSETSGSDRDFYGPFDAGLAFGAEVGSGPFSIQLRYTSGIVDIDQGVTGRLGADPVQNGVFAVMGLYTFGQ